MITDSLLQFILDWISINTHYDSSVFNYKIIQLSKQEIQMMACNGKCPIIPFFKPEVGVLISKMDFDNLCNQSILLHEIIHALQHLNNFEIQNIFKEREAYNIQNKFLLDISKKQELIDYMNIKKCRSLQLNVLM